PTSAVGYPSPRADSVLAATPEYQRRDLNSQRESSHRLPISLGVVQRHAPDRVELPADRHGERGWGGQHDVEIGHAPVREGAELVPDALGDGTGILIERAVRRLGDENVPGLKKAFELADGPIEATREAEGDECPGRIAVGRGPAGEREAPCIRL